MSEIGVATPSPVLTTSLSFARITTVAIRPTMAISAIASNARTIL
jgi:hypothetical protein